MRIAHLWPALTLRRGNRPAALFFSAGAVSIICLGSVVCGFWVHKISGAGNQIAIQVPASLVAGALGIVVWFGFIAPLRAGEFGGIYLRVVALSFPVCAALFVVTHYMVTGYLTSFGNIAAAWVLLLGECLMAAPVCSALARRAVFRQDFESSVLVVRSIGWPFLGGLEAYRCTSLGEKHLVKRIDSRVPGGGRDVRMDDIRIFLQESLAAGTEVVIVDLENVREVSTCLIGFWIYLKQVVENGGGKIVFAGPTPRTRMLFSVMKLDAVFAPTDTLAEALNRCSLEGGRAGI